MGHIVKNIIRIIAFFIVAVPIYYVCDLDSESTIYSAGIIATILSVTIGSSLTIMALNCKRRTVLFISRPALLLL